MPKKKSLEEIMPNGGVAAGGFVEEYCVKPVFRGERQVASGIGRDGREYPGSVPKAAPIGYSPPDQLSVMMEAMINRLRDHSLPDVETEEEANDFSVEGDPFDEMTPYEAVFMPAAQPGSVATAVKPTPAVAEAAVASPPPVASEPTPKLT